MTMLYDEIIKNAEQNLNRAALLCGEQLITYAGLLRMVDERAEKMPANLRAITLPVLADIDSVIALLACAKRGICLLPLPHGIARDEQEKLTKEVFDGLLEKMPYLLLHTSGTTAEPKLIALSQQTKVFRARQLIALYGLDTADVVLVGTPMHHSLAQRLVFSALLSGATALLMPKYSPENWLQGARSSSLIVGLPQQLMLLNNCDLLHARCLVSSSAPRSRLTNISQDMLYDMGIDYHECYGASEVAIATDKTIRVDSSADVGTAPEGVGVRIEADGEIAVKTPLLFDGYYKRPDLTAAVMIPDGYFLTGDSGYFGRFGELHLSGRLNDVIKVGGVKVYPEHVETAVRAVRGVKECAAIGEPDEKLGEHVRVVVIMEEDIAPVTLRWLQHRCAKSLSAAELPRSLSFVESLPRTETGKLLRRKLR